MFIIEAILFFIGTFVGILSKYIIGYASINFNFYRMILSVLHINILITVGVCFDRLLFCNVHITVQWTNISEDRNTTYIT